MFSFHKITLADKDWMKKLLWEDGWYGSEYSFGINVLWGIKYHIEVARAYDCCIVRYNLCGEYPWDNMMQGDNWIYSFPIGNGNKKALLDDLIREYRQQNKTLIMNSVGERARAELMAWYPDQFLLEENRDYEDYIYDREKLSSLTGRKMHNKRNHIARFKDAGEWNYEPLNDHNVEECKALCRRWVFSREDKWNDDMAVELKVLDAAFAMRHELGLVGGVLRQKGQLVAFCMGEAINADVFVVHFEKALPEYQGAYPMINQQFVQHACGDFKYINREDDAGDPGLRKAKLSYYPEILLKKYDAKLSPVVFADKHRHRQDIVQIWHTCFGDEEEFILDFLDKQVKDETMLLYFHEGKAVAMATFLPVTIHQGEERIEGRYVYAVATLPAYRHRGFAGAILTEAKELWQMPLLLSPAEEELVRYYEKYGFRCQYPAAEIAVASRASSYGDCSYDDCSHDDCFYDNCSSGTMIFTPLDAPTYKSLRDAHFAKDGYVEWDLSSISYALNYAAMENGEALRVSYNPTDNAACPTDGILLYEIQDDTVKITETTLPPKVLKEASHALLRKTGCHFAIRKSPQGMLFVPEESTLSLSFGQGYFNLCLGD